MTSFQELCNLRGRRALITGAAGKLGKTFSHSLAELGADLILLDLEGSSLEVESQELRKLWGIDVQVVYCDLESETEREKLPILISNERSDLSILVNNAALVGTAGIPGWNATFDQQSLLGWRKATEVNLVAIFHLCQLLMPNMKYSPAPSIVNIASIYGSYGPDWNLYIGTNMSNPAAYAATKGGLIQLTRWLATSLAPEIRVNAISPGGLFSSQPTSFVKKYESRTPLARMANEEDFKGAIGYLASDLSKYVTGHILEVNGGWGVW